ncbi:bifunctional adenosylcobinamide kinase/adenosylcobinamide-phosphate guanylyltransferase [Clostridium bornimense]|uniref:bifunctional adenosylcobinamide kinase/adenosylcobinamide-phosphate guanylyltransferase n=1 Tax=Clostridium bornimense TaxID=1216932 RepID=UPI001C10F17E|nr:bifunctional adenosylcobinamide kinase/adenosylcobinamide-phosphate guanylyltransferase [Clostridium bornimense]MBU5315319.1 bifunctional adenosylcobinamide kinase/adenosylcobinamide-phosphate guanylyltransferase [Clostridium bornimense]
MICFVVGGSKSGKSSYGEREAIRLGNKDDLYYIATMKPYDKEDEERIRAHIKQREGFGFKTIEQYRDIERIVSNMSNTSTILIDSITSLLTNEMFFEEEMNDNSSIKIVKGIKKIAQFFDNVVIISDYVFSDSIIYDQYTEQFRRELGNINIEIAKISDKVVECIFGNIQVHKNIEENQ